MDNVINLVQVLGPLLESMAVAVSVVVVAFALYQLIGKLSRVIDRFAETDFSQLFGRDQ